MSNTNPEFEEALKDILEGREIQLGHGPRKLLQEFYERGASNARGRRSTASSRNKIGNRVASFNDLQVGDVFQNDFLVGERRCRRVTQVIDADTVETEYVNTRNGAIDGSYEFRRVAFEGYDNYEYIADPA